PWGLEYRAIPGHPNTLMYYDDATFAAQLVDSTMDASYHHGAGFMPGASQLLYRMLGWLRGWRPRPLALQEFEYYSVADDCRLNSHVTAWPVRFVGSCSIALGAFAIGFAVTDIGWSSIFL